MDNLANFRLLLGETFTNILLPGSTLVITTPLRFKVGLFNYSISLGLDSFTENFEPESKSILIKNFNLAFLSLGDNQAIAEFVFSNGHLGFIRKGTDFGSFKVTPSF